MLANSFALLVTQKKGSDMYVDNKNQAAKPEEFWG